MLLYKAKPGIKELKTEELDRIAKDQLNPFGHCLNEWFINEIQFISLSFKDIRYWFPHTSNFKYFKKLYVKNAIEYYRTESDIIYKYNDRKWTKEDKNCTDAKEIKTIDRCRICLQAMEILYYIMIINKLDLDEDIKQYIKSLYNIKESEDVEFLP